MSTRKTASMALAVAATAAMAYFGATSAFAHARYKSSTPGTGEAITASPSRVEIVFTQEIQKIAGGYSLAVVKDRGLDITAGPAVVDDSDRTRLSVPLQANLSPGRYVVNWTNTSDADGDPAEGAFSFYLNYQPNTVDLANDAQLAQVGVEEGETPDAETSPTAAGVSTPAGSAAPTRAATSGSASPAASPTTVTSTATNDDDGLSTGALVAIIAVAAVVGIALGFGAWRFANRRT